MVEVPPVAPLPALEKPRCVVREPQSTVYEVAPVSDFMGPRLRAEGVATLAFAGPRDALLTIESRHADGTGYVLVGRGSTVYLHPGTPVSGPVVPSSEKPLAVDKIGHDEPVDVTLESFASRYYVPESSYRSPGEPAPRNDASAPPPIVVRCSALGLAPHPEAPPTEAGALATGSIVLYASATDRRPLMTYRPSDGGSAMIGGPPRGPEKPTFTGPGVVTLKRASGRALVSFVAAGHRVEAWVDASNVGKRTGPFQDPATRAPLVVPKGSLASAESRRCDKELPLYAATGRIGVFERAGTLFPRTMLRLGPKDGVWRGLRSIELDGVAPVREHSDNELRAPEVDLDECIAP